MLISQILYLPLSMAPCEFAGGASQKLNMDFGENLKKNCLKLHMIFQKFYVYLSKAWFVRRSMCSGPKLIIDLSEAIH